MLAVHLCCISDPIIIGHRSLSQFDMLPCGITNEALACALLGLPGTASKFKRRSESRTRGSWLRAHCASLKGREALGFLSTLLLTHKEHLVSPPEFALLCLFRCIAVTESTLGLETVCSVDSLALQPHRFQQRRPPRSSALRAIIQQPRQALDFLSATERLMSASSPLALTLNQITCEGERREGCRGM